ncbi:MAG: serine/threonine-protein kinase [Polyangiaceae bacterium]
MGGTIRPPAGETVADPLPSGRAHVDPSGATLFGGAPPRSQANPPRSNSISLAQGTESVGALPLVCAECGSRYPAEFRVCPRDATELVDVRDSLEDDDLVGKTLAGTYTITRVVGEGGMGRVYEARHQRVGGKRFAIKALHAEYCRNKEVLARFQREAETSSSIVSPNVVEVYDVLFTDDGRPFMVAEFLEGKELGDYIVESGRLSVETAMPIMLQICTGIAAAHAAGVIHRDLKPENVFLVGDINAPKVKILDFGISKSGDKPGTQLTKTGVIMGTPSFMAPEQARGERVTTAADIYAVGAILYTMLTGRRPFDKNDPTATLTAVLLEDPPRPRSLDPSIPEALEAVIQRAMAKAPLDRYASVVELEQHLAPFAQKPEEKSGGPAAARPSRTVSEAELTHLRSQIVRTGPAALGFAISAFALILTGVLRSGRPGHALSGAQAVIALLVPLVLGGMAGGFTLAYIRGMPGEEARRSDTMAGVFAMATSVGLVTLGFGFLFERFVESVVLRGGLGTAWPAWEVLLPLVAVVGAGIAAVFTFRSASR